MGPAKQPPRLGRMPPSTQVRHHPRPRQRERPPWRRICSIAMLVFQGGGEAGPKRRKAGAAINTRKAARKKRRRGRRRRRKRRRPPKEEQEHVRPPDRHRVRPPNRHLVRPPNRHLVRPPNRHLVRTRCQKIRRVSTHQLKLQPRLGMMPPSTQVRHQPRPRQRERPPWRRICSIAMLVFQGGGEAGPKRRKSGAAINTRK